MMAREADCVLCEAQLLHTSTGNSFSCRKKKHWWQSDHEAEGHFVEKENTTYAVKFSVSRREVCCHELPKVGKAVILRQIRSNSRNSLFIAEIKEYCISREELPTLMLSFSSSDDFTKWENKLRNKLLVYSFHIEIEDNQIVEKGPATLHLTTEYIYITNNRVDGKFKALYHKNRKKNSVICYDRDNLLTLDIHCLEGHRETIDFKSKHFSHIKDTLSFFENEVVKKPIKSARQKSSSSEDIKKPTKRSLSAECNSDKVCVKLNPAIHSQSRYSKDRTPAKTLESEIDEKQKISSKPCIYSYNVLDNKVDRLESDASNDIYICSKDLKALKAEENGDCSENACSDGWPTLSYLNGSTFLNGVSETEDYVSMNDSVFKAHHDTSSCGSSSSFTQLHQHCLSNRPTEIVPRGGAPVVGEKAKENGDHPQGELSNGYRNKSQPRPMVVHLPPPFSLPCREEREESPSEKKSGVGEKSAVDVSCSPQEHPVSDGNPACEVMPVQECFLKQGSASTESDRCRKSPRVRCPVEEWTPKNLFPDNMFPKSDGSDDAPPIIARESSPSLHPQLHFYENSSSMIQSDENENSSREPIETAVHVFGNEMEHGGAWTVGAILLQRDDNETLERLKYLESKFGRHQLTPPRSFDITSDIMISVNEGSPGFGILGQRSHILQYGDLKQLGPSRWIVVEFHFLHHNEKYSIFKCDIGVEPICCGTVSTQSHYTSQNISVVRKIARTESLPEDRHPLSPPRSRIPLRTTSRQELCRDLDLPSTLGDNWKFLAAKIGLDIREIRIIEYGKHSSCTEEVLQILERRYPEHCTKEFLEATLREMRRPDLVEHLR